MKNRAHFATLASVPVVLLALLACKGFSKSEPKPTVSATATTAAATAEPTTVASAAPTADVPPELSAKPLATFGSSTAATAKPGVTGTTAASVKAAPSASTAASAKPATSASAATAGKDAGAALATNAVFKVGDKVQVFWKNSWYPASVVAVPATGLYKIHYDGYEASWDETVGNARIKAR